MTEQRSPQDPSHPDPFALWRQYYEANEQAWTKALKEALTTQGYAEAQGKMLEVFLYYQKLMRDAMSTQLSTLNLPTRDDVARLGELIVGLEEKVDGLDDRGNGTEGKLAQLGDKLASLEAQLTRLDARLASIDGRLGKLTPSGDGDR